MIEGGGGGGGEQVEPLAGYVITHCGYCGDASCCVCIINKAIMGIVVTMITYPANSYCSQANSLQQYTTVCRLMMVI
jgi:hypothetical protein